MSTFQVIVKGTPTQAAKAAADRGIPFVYARHIKRFSETVGLVNSEHEDKLHAWLAEMKEPPFPAGTLLFWNDAYPLKHETFDVEQLCACSDPGCPVHPREDCCHRYGRAVLYRVDMEDHTGTRFCTMCKADALDSGLFYSKS